MQQHRSKWNDKFIKAKNCKQGDYDLLLYSKLKKFQGKFQTHYFGPYEIDTICDDGAVKINNINVENFDFLVNGHILRLYYELLTT